MNILLEKYINLWSLSFVKGGSNWASALKGKSLDCTPIEVKHVCPSVLEFHTYMHLNKSYHFSA